MNAVKEYLDGKGSMSSIAKRLDIVYQSFKQWVKNYEAMGVDALQDNRGKRKPEDSLTEIERLRAELKLEKAKRQKPRWRHHSKKNATKQRGGRAKPAKTQADLSGD